MDPFKYQPCRAQLRNVLNSMFSSDYIERHIRAPNCSLFSENNSSIDHQSQQTLEASSEPSSRAHMIELIKRFDVSLKEHQAKSHGLCPIRRAIYDQCFDELIRQVTVGCIEQGLLLFRIRNELRMTVGCYKRAFESGVKFGINRALKAELELRDIRNQITKLESLLRADLVEDRVNKIELKNKTDSIAKLEDYYKSELIKRDYIIEQQRAMMGLLRERPCHP